MTKRCIESESWIKAQERSLLTRANAKQQRRINYNLNPALCNVCNGSIPFKNRKGKYCSRSCAVTENNRRDPKRKIASRIHLDGTYTRRLCEICSAVTDNKTCSKKCYSEMMARRTEQRILSGENVSAGTLRSYLLKHRENVCSICRMNDWMGKPIPLDVDHIDGNPENHAQENLRLLCKNCHAQTPTYGAKNFGKGRKKRQEVYKRLGYS